jgi:outer membrane lipoprotein-sorting protein
VFDADNAHSLALPANRVDGRHKRVKTMEIMTIRHSGVNTALALLAAACLACAAPGRAAEAVPQAGGDDAEARMIVEKADQVRFPADGFQVDVSITTTGSGPSTEVRKYRVLSKGNTNSVVMVTEPASERGQILLMKGRDLWVFMPDVSQPIRLSLSQRLTGQVANGDLARANFAADYNPKLLRSEKIGNEDFHVLELIGVDRSVTYQRVHYWVREKDFWPHKAEFYSLSNRLLKTCRYENYKTMEGRKRPTRLVMEDALRGGEQSVLEYGGMKLRDLPDKIFRTRSIHQGLSQEARLARPLCRRQPAWLALGPALTELTMGCWVVPALSDALRAENYRCTLRQRLETVSVVFSRRSHTADPARDLRRGEARDRFAGVAAATTAAEHFVVLCRPLCRHYGKHAAAGGWRLAVGAGCFFRI